MIKKAFSWLFLFLFLLLVTGCQKNNSIVQNKPSQKIEWGGFLISNDGGKTWEMKNKAGEKNIFNLNILSLDVASQGYLQTIFFGTKNKGILKSIAGEDWEHLQSFNLVDVYALAVDEKKDQQDQLLINVYAVGSEKKRGKIYKSKDGGETWKEIYTEPKEGIKVISLALDSQGWLYAGDTKGSLFRSKDGGETWENVFIASAPIVKIKIDKKDNNIIYLLLYKKGVLFSVDRGKEFHSIEEFNQEKIKNIIQGKDEKIDLGTVYSIALDEKEKGCVYLGTDKGVFYSQNAGKKLYKLNTLGSSNGFPIKALAISPFNSQKIIYTAGKTIYVSDNKGKTWRTFQLDTNKEITNLFFSRDNTEVIFATMGQSK